MNLLKNNQQIKMPELKFENNQARETALEKREEIDDFFNNETMLREKIEKAANETADKKSVAPFANKILRLLTALSIFISGSSSFAKGIHEEEIKKGLRQSKPAQSEMLKDENHSIAPEISDSWKKIIKRLDLSVAGMSEYVQPFNGGVSDNISTFNNLTQSDFYKDFSKNEYAQAVRAFRDSVLTSDNSDIFFQKLNRLSNFAPEQKTLILQNIGAFLSDTYNFDMLENNQHIKISDQTMFQTMKELMQNEKITPGGLCGNIHSFLSKAAGKMGMESWLQSGTQNGHGHIFSGLLVETKQNKQIAFLNNNELICAGTLNYKDALGIAERQMNSVGCFSSFVGGENEFYFPVKSRAQEKIEKAGGIADISESISGNLAEGEIGERRNALAVEIDPETKIIGLTKDCVGLSFLNYENINENPYQSMDDLNALRGSLNFTGNNLSLAEDATILRLNMKDLSGDNNMAYSELINRVAADFIDSHKFNKNEYGQFILNYGASLQAALKLPLDQKIENSAIDLMGEGAIGGRIIYLDPANIGKFYIGASEVSRGQLDNPQDNDIIIKEASKHFTLGAEIEVNEGQILNMETTQSRIDWGKKIEIKGGLEGKKWRGEIKSEKAASRFERFMPSTEKISAEIGYKRGPKWEVDILGFKAEEKYADASEQKSYGAEVKLRIFLW